MDAEGSPPELSITTSERAGAHVVAVAGELDLSTSPELDRALAEGGPGARVCLDLTRLRFIDSTGLAAIVRAHQSLVRAGGALAIATGSGPRSVLRTFESTGLAGLLTITDSAEQALQALG